MTDNNNVFSTEQIQSFLDGQGTHSNLKHVRYVDVPYYANEGSVVIRDEKDNVEVKTIGYNPFVWAKDIDFNYNFTYDVIEIPISKYFAESNTAVNKNSEIIQIDGVNNIYLGINENNPDYVMVKTFLPSLLARKKLFEKKIREYNVIKEELNTVIDGKSSERIKNGYTTRYTIKEKITRHKYDKKSSSNPLFKYKQNGKVQQINGSFSNLINFFKEGGIDIYERAGTFFNKEKLQSTFDSLTDKEKFNFYLSTVTPFKNSTGHIDIMREFWGKDSFNVTKCINFLNTDKIEYKNKLKNIYQKEYTYDGGNIYFSTDFDEYTLKNVIQYDNLNHKYVGEFDTLYVTSDCNKLTDCDNVHYFLQGVIRMNDNWENTIKKNIAHDFKKLINKINGVNSKAKDFIKYKKIVFDDSALEIVCGDFYGNVQNMILEQLEPLEIIGKIPNTFTATNVFKYLNYIDIDKFINRLKDEGEFKNIFKPSINYELIDELNKNGRRDSWSFHTSKYGRKFVEICDENKWEIFDLNKSDFYILNPVSQFMFQSGIRLWGGYEYKDLTRLTIDIETRGQVYHQQFLKICGKYTKAKVHFNFDNNNVNYDKGIFITSYGEDIIPKKSNVINNFLSYEIASNKKWAYVKTYLEEKVENLFTEINSKGIYNDIVFDFKSFENLFKNQANAALFPDKGETFMVGLYTNKGYQKILHADTIDEEKQMYIDTWTEIATVNPDILLGYYSENFDFPFIENRMKILGMIAEEKDGKFTVQQYIRNIIKPIFDSVYGDFYISNREYYNYQKGTLKAGGDTKETRLTKIFGINVMDGIHQTYKMQAINKNIEYAKLKWNIIYNKIEKKNRVYIIGNEIGKVSKEKREILFNDINGDWFINEKKYSFDENNYDVANIKIGDGGKKFYLDNNKLFLYSSDCLNDCVINKCENSFRIDCGYESKESIDNDFDELYLKTKEYEEIVIPFKRNGLLLKETDVAKYKYLMDKFSSLIKDCSNLTKLYKHLDFNDYTPVSGSYIVERYLIDDLWETDVLFEKYAQSVFLLSKWGHMPFYKLANMGNASIWKILISCYHYQHNIAIPAYDNYREINGGLIGMTKSGFSENIVKLDFSSLYPAFKLWSGLKASWDISEIGYYLLHFFLMTRLKYKALSNEYKASGVDELASMYKMLEGPLKIFINTEFGFISAMFVSMFADMMVGQGTTAGSRMVARHTIRYYNKFGFQPIYSHTDGINFICPDGYDDYLYTGLGDNWLVEKDKSYNGLKAYVAEYNDKYFKGDNRMGLDIDDFDKSCINIAKSNVVHYKEGKNGKCNVSITGGLIKKDTPEYIKEFIENNIEFILKKQPLKFIQAYYAHLNDIWSYNIVNKKIANKAKVNKTLEDYYLNKKVNQAPYELIRAKNLNIDLGDFIYWVNNGDKEKSPDYTINKEKIGHIILREKNIDIENALKSYKEYPNDVKTLIIRAWIENQFVFSRSRTINGMVDKNHLLEKFNDCKDLLFSYTKKTSKKIGDYYQLNIEIHHEEFNCQHIPQSDYDGVSSGYNRAKYIAKFNGAIEPIFLVFDKSVRGILIKNKPINGANFEIPMLTKEQLKLINGQPLDGKENNEQNLEDLLLVQEIERKYWVDASLDPNYFLTRKKLTLNKYGVNSGEYVESEIGMCDMVVNKIGIVDWLCANLLDEVECN